MDVHFSSKSNEWATPRWLFDLLDEKYGFTLDPAADKYNAKCSKFFTKEDDGLKQDWSGDTVFCNPPYGRQISKWIEKAHSESLKSDNTIVMLVPARTDTRYWHNHIFGVADSIYFLKGRLKFGDAQNSAPFPSALIVYNDHQKYIGGVDLDKYKKVRKS